MPIFEARHEAVTGNFILCDGGQFGVKLNGYLPKKPETFVECRARIGRCLKGYKGKTASDSACDYPAGPASFENRCNLQ